MASLILASEPPYWAACVSVPHDMAARWRVAAVKLASDYRACERAGEFPGPFEGVTEYDEPVWANPNAGNVDMGGCEE